MRNRKQNIVLALAMTGFVLVFLGLALITSACGAKQYHIATVSVVSVNAAAGALQDTADAFVCGTPTAPPEGSCLSKDQRKAVAAKLSPTFEKTGQIAQLVEASAPGQPLPTAIGQLLAEAKSLLNEALALLPEGAQARVIELTGGK